MCKMHDFRFLKHVLVIPINDRRIYHSNSVKYTILKGIYLYTCIVSSYDSVSSLSVNGIVILKTVYPLEGTSTSCLSDTALPSSLLAWIVYSPGKSIRQYRPYLSVMTSFAL